jgi:hypothetical protein
MKDKLHHDWLPPDDEDNLSRRKMYLPRPNEILEMTQLIRAGYYFWVASEPEPDPDLDELDPEYILEFIEWDNRIHKPKDRE